MKTVFVKVGVKVPDNTTGKKVVELVDKLINIGLQDASDTTDNGDDGTDIDDANTVLSWQFQALKLIPNVKKSK